MYGKKALKSMSVKNRNLNKTKILLVHHNIVDKIIISICYIIIRLVTLALRILHDLCHACCQVTFLGVRVLAVPDGQGKRKLFEF